MPLWAEDVRLSGSGEWEYLLTGADPQDPLSWWTEAEWAAASEEPDTAPPGPAAPGGGTQAERDKATALGWDMDRPLPTRMVTVDEEQPNKDVAGNPVYVKRVTQMVDMEAVYRWAEAQAKGRAAEERYQEQTAYARNQAQERAREAQRNVETDDARQQAQQAAAAARQPTSLEALQAEAILSGNVERAFFLRDFQNAPTSHQMLQLSLEYADNPAALKVLYDFIHGSYRNPFTKRGQDPSDPFGGNLLQRGVAAGLLPPEYASPENIYPFNVRGALDFLTPARLQQAELGQQFRQGGGVLAPFQQEQPLAQEVLPPFSPATPLARPQNAAFPGGEAGEAGGPSGLLTQPAANLPGFTSLTGPKPAREPFQAGGGTGALVVGTPSLKAAKEFGDFLSTIHEGTPRDRTENPWMFASDAALEAVRRSGEPDVDQGAAQTEIDRRAGVGASQVARGPEGSFADFMRGGPDLRSTPAERGAFLAGPTEAQQIATGSYFDRGNLRWTSTPVRLDPQGGLVPFEQVGQRKNDVDPFGFDEFQKTLRTLKPPAQRRVIGSPFLVRRR